jgi:thioesterase domain-containing protein
LTTTEIITALISLLAVSVSLVALRRSRQNNAQLLELEKVHAELSRRQIDEIEERKREALKAKLTVRLEKADTDYRFVITNQGQSTASNIYFGIEQGNEHNPLVRGDFEQKIPFPALAPNESYHLLAHIPIDIRQLTYEISIRWNNPDGTQGREIQSVTR